MKQDQAGREAGVSQRQQQQEDDDSISGEARTLLLLCTAVAFICSIDRAAMSVAILPMSQQYGWDDTVKGAVASAFFAGKAGIAFPLGYMVTNLCGGFLATRYSAKGVLAAGVALWSVFTVATPAAAASADLTQLLAARGAMGLGEGVAYPSVQNLVRRWVPAHQRSRGLALVYSGHQMGTLSSYLTAPTLISALDWRAVFWLFGSLGFVWLLLWHPLAADAPPEAPAQRGSRWKQQQKQQAEKPLQLGDVPWAAIARNRAFWAIVAAQVSVSCGNILAFSWLPTYYQQEFGVDVAGSAALSVVPFLATAAATLASGVIADGLVNRGVLSRTATRRLMQGIASLGPAACLMALAADHAAGSGQARSAAEAMALVTAWLSLCGFSAAGYGSNHQDISRRFSGILYGLGNGLASVAGSVGIYATGQVLSATHDWGIIFEAAAVLYVVGAAAYLAGCSCEEQFDCAEMKPARRW